MFINNNIKYRDILIFGLIGIVGYKIIDNYDFFFDLTKKFLSIISPFIYSLICAYMLNPIMMFFERNFKFSRSRSILITYAIIAGIVVMFLFFTIPSLINSIGNMTKEVPNYMQVVQGWINAALKNKKLYGLITQAGLLEKIQLLSIQIGNFTVTILQGMLTYLLSFTTNLVKILLGFLIAIYVLADKENIINGAKTLCYIILKEKKANKLINFVRIYNKMVGAYIGTKAVDSSIIGLISLVGLIIVEAPYALLLALIVGITNMIPYFGPFVGIIIGVIASIFISPMKAVIVCVLLVGIQQFDAWYLEPKLVGAKIGVKPFWIIMGIMIAGAFLGPLGMLLASPTMATMRVYYIEVVKKFKANNAELVKREKI
ncbi:AI-2E family transporter [Clostridium uliginosum]|uniref:Predicted PurR-regulated permease PerM n=1 Tax=Clostridium uliginosum TaxID=119641 RepID=A0A1I1K9D2_9CLOT|nr:AI-2E family transporter [Clostridium uliginosum]SFC56902.1 Predicted PurR-regulated permease PerM [Clostridium uliginosum]